ncbi:DUF2294 domain-containing protein [Jeotgalibacillus sp. S-D1]|uniref:DUF2294 domain-containing protein n=1 Tax=Jeotgalibacillus sp. S-D1 TaxID=2552189 RepID=UPI00105A5E08|nr:Na-translocating system protein MpsC family protein [Jeotgalibacillus sp. S-D1]TDL31248.1 DUF2294 domain-containing protein [Jeotgalibacillus sp. S-D1]
MGNEPVKEKSVQSKIGSYISSLLRDHFGKGPTSVYVTIKKPYVIVHVRGFLAPTEKILVKQKQSRRVLETRDLLMEDLKQAIKLELWKIANLDVKQIFTDWNLENKTGVFIALLEQEEGDEHFDWPENIDMEAFKSEAIDASQKAQKKPENINVSWLNDRSILIARSGLFVEIEKELIKNGFIEELRLAKRPLETRLIKQSNLESILQQNIHEVFVDWDFQNDKGYMVLILAKNKNE